MNRYEAGKLVRSSAWLRLSERTLMLVLLERAHNKTCEIEAKYAPHSRDELARWAGVSVRQVQRGLQHLERHGWLALERGNGRGKGTRYCLVPRLPDVECHCPKGDTRVQRETRPDPEDQKGDTMSGKGRHGVLKRETFESESSHVNTDFQARTARTKEEKGQSGCKVNPDDDCSGAGVLLSCQLCPMSPTYWRRSA